MASCLEKKIGKDVWFFISLIHPKKCIINCFHVIFLMDPWWNVIPEFILHFISTQIICIDVWGNHPLGWISLQRKVPIDITVCVLADTPYVTDLLILLQYNSTVNKQVLIFRRQMALVLYILCIFFLPIGKKWVVFAKCRTVHWENTDFKHVFSLKERFY